MPENNPEDYDLLIKDGQLLIRLKWCDCKPPGFGLVKIAEGRWGRPCCHRPVNRAQAMKWQEQDQRRSHGVNDREE